MSIFKGTWRRRSNVQVSTIIKDKLGHYSSLCSFIILTTRGCERRRKRKRNCVKMFFQVCLFWDLYFVWREALLSLNLGFNDPHWDSLPPCSLFFSPFTHVRSKESESSDRTAPVEAPWPRFHMSLRCNRLGQRERDKIFESALAETLWSGNGRTSLLQNFLFLKAERGEANRHAEETQSAKWREQELQLTGI